MKRASDFGHLAISGLVHMRDMPAFFMAPECLDYCCFAIGFGPSKYAEDLFVPSAERRVL